MSDKAHILNKIIVRNRLLDGDYLGDWLSLASAEGKVGSMKVLIGHGANIDYKNSEGETAFSYSCANNQFAAAKLLHENGADINTVDNGGGTPLDWVVCWCSPEFRDWLKAVGGIRKSNYEEWDWETVTKPRAVD